MMIDNRGRCELGARHVPRLDGHAAGIAYAITLSKRCRSTGVFTRPLLAGLAEYTVS